MRESGRLLYLVRPSGSPPPATEEETRLVLTGKPGDADAPDLEAVVEAILEHERVVVW